ncbi:MAG: hypothetical protein NDI61_13705 [Bdellovibrionaceae bacterium]|nr:hypothetical protein [Pseudobdellovibrionaceae bacterium]
MSNPSQRCFCAFCRSPRTVYLHQHITGVDVVLSLVASLLLMLVVFQDFDPRFLVFFVVVLAVAESFIHIRWRLTITCPRCGFDPIIYKRDPARAAARVKAFLDRRKEDPLSALAPPPNLPVIVKKKGLAEKDLR